MVRSDGSLFNWIAKKLRPKEIEDPVFGRLLFIGAKGKSCSYWQGRGYFDPVCARIEYFINGDGAPKASHYAVYRQIGEKYPDLLLSVTPLLRLEWAKQMAGPTPNFTLESLSIPEAESDLMDWSMDFSCAVGDDWLFTVYMRGWRPTGNISVIH